MSHFSGQETYASMNPNTQKEGQRWERDVFRWLSNVKIYSFYFEREAEGKDRLISAIE